MFFTYSTSIFAPSSPFFHTSFVILLCRLSSPVFLHCHMMCSSVSFALQNGQSRSGVPSILLRCVALLASQCHFANLCSSFFLSLHSPSSSQLLCQLLAISVLIHLLKSSGGYFSSFEIDSSRARFASALASSFPVIPACPGTQHSVTLPL
jgi:hypothetical protein